MAISNKIITLAIVTLMISVCAASMIGSDDADAEATSYPVTVKTNTADSASAIEQKYSKAPERVIVGNVTCLEFFLYFGLQDKIVGIYYNEDEIDASLQAEYKKLCDRIGEKGTAHNLEGMMTQAVATDLNPDLIMGYKSSFGTSSWAIGTTAYWNGLNCNVWSLNTQASATSMNVVGMEQDYTDFGAVFDIATKTTDYIASYKAALSSVKTSGVKFAVIEYRTDKTSYSNYSDKSFIGNVIINMNCVNAFHNDKNVQKSTLIDNTDIQAIIIVCFGANTPADMVKAMLEDKTLAGIPAVKAKNVVGIGLSQTYGGVEALSTLNTMVEMANKAPSVGPSSDSSNNDNTVLYVGIVAVVIIAIIGAAVFVIRSKA